MSRFFPLFLALVPLFAEEVSVPAPPPTPPLCPQSYMAIDPKFRADDLSQAFERLRKEKTAAKVYFKIKEGEEISNIIDMTPMPNGTIILFRYNTPQGIKFQAVNVEQIASLGYYP